MSSATFSFLSLFERAGFDRNRLTFAFKTRYGHWEWKMRNGGTAYVEDVMGNVYIFADPKQESGLDE